MLVQGNSIFHEAPSPINDLGPCLHPERLFATGHTVLHHLNISGRLPNEFPVHQHPFLGMDLGGDVVVDVVVAIVGMGAVWGGDIHGTISFRRVLNGKHLVGCVLKGERFPLVVPLLLLEHM